MLSYVYIPLHLLNPIWKPRKALLRSIIRATNNAPFESNLKTTKKRFWEASSERKTMPRRRNNQTAATHQGLGERDEKNAERCKEHSALIMQVRTAPLRPKNFSNFSSRILTMFWQRFKKNAICCLQISWRSLSEFHRFFTEWDSSLFLFFFFSFSSFLFLFFFSQIVQKMLPKWMPKIWRKSGKIWRELNLS